MLEISKDLPHARSNPLSKENQVQQFLKTFKAMQKEEQINNGEQDIKLTQYKMIKKIKDGNRKFHECRK